MLSVLIPVYNYDVRSLVGALARQCLEAQIPFEILCWDDGSEEAFDRKNQKIIQLEGVTYYRLGQNVGRSAIRNHLARAAKYDHLLFLDCDSGVTKEDYIDCYLKEIGKAPVVCGGRIYESNPPEDPKYYFHWKYGSRREVRTAEMRNLAPHSGFMSNNFMVQKTVLLKTPFDEQLVQYGHEDTLWGEELKAKGIAIKHIENVILHLGLDPAEQFINKTKEALENLVILRKAGKPISIRLDKIAERGKKWGLPFFAKRFGQSLLNLMEINFTSSSPSLSLFDFYRLLYLSRIE